MQVWTMARARATTGAPSWASRMPWRVLVFQLRATFGDAVALACAEAKRKSAPKIAPWNFIRNLVSHSIAQRCLLSLRFPLTKYLGAFLWNIYIDRTLRVRIIEIDQTLCDYRH